MKRILVLLVAIICFVGVKAQVYYYVKAGDDPNDEYASCYVIRVEQSGRLVWLYGSKIGGNNVAVIKSRLMNDPQYYEKLKPSNEIGWYCYSFKNSQSNMNIYMYTELIGWGDMKSEQHYYMALSYDYKNLIMNPDRGDKGLIKKAYYKQVPKSTFEFKGMNF